MRLWLFYFLLRPSFPSQVESYFKEIPQTKIPKIGTLGEKYRDIQLFYQIPPQDLLPQNCLYLEEKYWPRFNSMVQERNEIALDVATVQYVYDVNGVSALMALVLLYLYF